MKWNIEWVDLKNIERMIAECWRMNNRQLERYYRELSQQQELIFASELGITFLELMHKIIDGSADYEWAELHKDVHMLEKLIQNGLEQDEAYWKEQYQELTEQPEFYFYTKLGKAFTDRLVVKLELDISDRQKLLLYDLNQIQKICTSCDLENEAKVQKIISFLTQKNKIFFYSWIGDSFVKELQERFGKKDETTKLEKINHGFFHRHTKSPGQAAAGGRKSDAPPAAKHAAAVRKGLLSVLLILSLSFAGFWLFSLSEGEQGLSYLHQFIANVKTTIAEKSGRADDKNTKNNDAENQRIDESPEAGGLQADEHESGHSRRITAAANNERNITKTDDGTAETVRNSSDAGTEDAAYQDANAGTENEAHNSTDTKKENGTSNSGADTAENPAGSPEGPAQSSADSAEGSAQNSAGSTEGSAQNSAGSPESPAQNLADSTEDPAQNSAGSTEGSAGSAQNPQPAVPEILPQYQAFHDRYPDLFGWLKIPDTGIDVPVMQSDDEERGEKYYYLHRDYTGRNSTEGSLFVDTGSSCYPQDDNTVIYGHNMTNGHIFGTLSRFENQNFFKEHQLMQYDTIYETGTYKAVAVLKTRILYQEEEGFRYYRFFNYHTDSEFQECLDFLKAHQLFDTGEELEYGDRILMLSTCEYSQENGRLVVVAKRLDD